MVSHHIYCPHLLHSLRVVGSSQEENLARVLLPNHFRQVRRAVAGVERANICVGLLEPRLLTRRHREIAHNMQGVATPSGPPVDHGNHHFRHGADQPLHL